MSDYFTLHFNDRTDKSHALSRAVVVPIERPSFDFGWQGLRLFGAALVVSAFVISSAQLMRSFALSPGNRSASIVQSGDIQSSNTDSNSALPTPAPLEEIATKPDSSDLQVVLDRWQGDYPAAKFGVVVSELTGPKRKSNLSPITQFRAASIYKLYIADYIYDQVSNGNISLSSTLGMYRSVGDCIKPMIVVSDNACGESLGGAIGWTRLNNYVHSAGFVDTNLVPVNVTTAADVAKYLEQLYDGTLISNAELSKQLLSHMSVQKFRSAIPAGVPGVPVADKVGYIPGVWNDGAIVYGPKSTYVLVVLSQNSRSSAIKDLSTRVADILNQPIIRR